MDEVTLGEAAEMLNMSRRLLQDLVDGGHIPARTNSAVIRISRADIEVFRRRADSGAFESLGAEICALFSTDSRG
jgi:excisionase family DNA binding protein